MQQIHMRCSTASPDFIHVTNPEPHIGRTKQILRAHPEIKKLFGNTPSSAFCVFGVVAFQILVAISLRDSSWFSLFLWSYTAGAFANHALFVLIHECAHNLIFVSTRANQVAGIIANLPIIFPSAISFKRYHLIHHRHQGEMGYDADLPSPTEAKVVGKSSIMKALWFFFFFIIEGIVRPLRVKKVQLLDGWTLANIGIELSFLALLTYFAGPKAFIYLALSSIFSIGLHPLGARWIQEHFVFKKDQETYSYYGWLNKLCFNVGYHNEHHDLVRVPWSRLPAAKAMAPEFYDTLYSHSSWTSLFFQFILQPENTLFNRAVRPDRNEGSSKVEPAHEAHLKTLAKVAQPLYTQPLEVAPKILKTVDLGG